MRLRRVNRYICYTLAFIGFISRHITVYVSRTSPLVINLRTNVAFNFVSFLFFAVGLKVRSHRMRCVALRCGAVTATHASGVNVP